MKLRVLGIAALMLASMAARANAGIVQYSGSDDGASAVGPWPNSAAAESSFLAAAAGFGTLSTIDFESQPVGYNANFTAAPGVNVALTGSNFGPGFSGISNTTFGGVYGFNVTSGGANWLGFAGGTATFSFAPGVNSFGFYLTGVQTIFTGALDVIFNDGSAQSLSAPINGNGGASYFGFTDDGTTISSITISNLSNDAWGIDNVTFGQATSVPEPTSLAMFGLGAVGLIFARRKRRQKKLAA